MAKRGSRKKSEDEDGGDDVSRESEADEAAVREAGPLMTTKLHRADVQRLQKIAALLGAGSVAAVVRRKEFQEFMSHMLVSSLQEELRREGRGHSPR